MKAESCTTKSSETHGMKDSSVDSQSCCSHRETTRRRQKRTNHSEQRLAATAARSHATVLPCGMRLRWMRGVRRAAPGRQTRPRGSRSRCAARARRDGSRCSEGPDGRGSRSDPARATRTAGEQDVSSQVKTHRARGSHLHVFVDEAIAHVRLAHVHRVRRANLGVANKHKQ